jgi:ATP-dependent HslUV protease subunit HslV
VIEPDKTGDGSVLAIGSGGNYALAAGRALLAHTQLDAAAIAKESLRIAGDICVYTNGEITVEELS